MVGLGCSLGAIWLLTHGHVKKAGALDQKNRVWLSFRRVFEQELQTEGKELPNSKRHLDGLEKRLGGVNRVRSSI